MTRLRSFFSRPTTSPAMPMLIAASAALALAVVACDSGTQEPAAPTPAAPDAAQAPAATEDGAAKPPAAAAREGDIDSARFLTDLPEGVTAAVPDNFPADVPIYPGSQPAQGKGVEIDGSPQAAVQLLTNDAYSDVQTFYRDQLQSKGWTFSEDSSSEGAAVIQASKDKCKVNILVTPVEGGGSDIFIATEC